MAAGVLVYALVREGWIEQLDTSLASQARAVAALFEVGPNGVELESVRLDPAESWASDRQYYEAWDASGRVIVRSPSLGGVDLPFLSLPVGTARYRWVRLPDSRSARAITVPVEARPESETAEAPPLAVVLAVARDAGDVSDLLERLRTTLFGAWLAVSVVLAGALALLVRRGLAPLAVLSHAIASRDERGLGEPVVLERTPDELRPVAP